MYKFIIFVGNPHEECRVIGCYSNSDCPSDHACVNMQCVNPCIHNNPCALLAECTVRHHLPVCRCPAHHIGNPYIACEREIEPECRDDEDCPNLLACFNERCQNPCTTIHPCLEPSECQVLPSLPVRTMLCICPSGYISTGSGTCAPTVPLIGRECTYDSDCVPEKSCINAVCRDPCACGLNAVCNVINHKPICTCAVGYDGNPETECVRGKIIGLFCINKLFFVKSSVQICFGFSCRMQIRQ